jgi:hypothetical protein
MKKAIVPIAIFASAMFGSVAHAQTTPPAAAPAAMQASKPDAASNRVEQHIKRLHDQLKITADQETQWSQVAQTMRDNAAKIDSVLEKREGAQNPTALDDLNSYAELTQANSDGVKKLSAVFTPLYNAMTDAQKKNADEVFSEHQNHRTVHNKKAAPKKG